MHQSSSSDILASRKRDDIILAGLVVLAILVGLYAAYTLGTTEFLTSATLFAMAGLLTIRGHRMAVAARMTLTDMVDRRHLEARVEEAQVNYQSIFNNALEGLFQSTPEGSFITANPAMALMLGRETPEALVNETSGWPAHQFFADNVRWAELVRLLETQGSVSEFEAEVVRDDGHTVWLSHSLHPVRDESGAIAYFEGMAIDITGRRWAERRRALQYATARILSEAASVVEARPKILQAICDLLNWDMGAVWDVIASDNILRCVEIWHAQGIDISEFQTATEEVTFAPGVRLAGRVWQTGEPAWVVNFSEDEFSLNAMVAAKYGMNSAFGIPIKVGGEVMHVLEFFSPKASEPDRELLQMLGVIANQIGYLVERKLAEESLRDTVSRKAAILESALDCIITFDHVGRVIEWNPATERTFGYRRADVLGRPLSELIVPESLRSGPCSGLPLYNAAAASYGRRSEIAVMRSNGHEFPAEIALAKVQVHGKPFFTAYLRDLTETKRAQRLQSELAAVVAASDDAIVSETLDGVIVSWNPGAERIFGYSAQEMINRHISTIVPAEQMDEFIQELATLRQGHSIQNFEVVRLRKDGKRICVSLTEAPIRNERGVITGIASTARDVTENKRMAGQALQTQKMEAVGRLAGGVAHDFNNIITAILGYSDLLLTQVPPEGAEFKNISEIRKAGQFAAALTHQLLAFSRGQALEVKVLDINEIISGLQPILRRLIGDQIHIVVVPSEQPGLVRGDPGQLEQVLLNLALNARDAMNDGGVITVQTSNVVITPEESSASADEVPPGRWVKLVVRDTGSGMSASVKDHLFEPFFTTKERGRGTGLGLATCYGVVKQSGGQIHCDSAPGLGTTFRIYLPRVSGDTITTTPGEQDFEGLDNLRGSETILLVEDERSVRRLTVFILRKIGYRVMEARNAEEAKEMLRLNPECKVDLLLADVVLPNTGGKELADWVLANSPETCVLFTSGYVEETVFNNYGVDAGMAFLQKPFTPVALAKKVREAIEQRGKSGK